MFARAFIQLVLHIGVAIAGCCFDLFILVDHHLRVVIFPRTFYCSAQLEGIIRQLLYIVFDLLGGDNSCSFCFSGIGEPEAFEWQWFPAQFTDTVNRLFRS